MGHPPGNDRKEMVGVPYLCWLILTIEDHINDISGAKVSHLNGDGKREEKTMLKETTHNVNVPLYFQWISVTLTLAFRSSQKTHRQYIT
jgi:hypothetical protein